MSNKKNKLILGLLAIAVSGVGLASCSDIVAELPSDEETVKLVDNSAGDLDVTNNTMKQIYDALVNEGDTNSEKVLSNVLYIYSTSVYGDFFEIKAAIDANNTTALQTFADTYAIYNKSVTTLKNIYRDILYRVKKVFWGYVTNSSYQYRTQFNEKKFHDAQVKAYYSVGDTYFNNYVQVEGSTRLVDPNDTTTEANLKSDELSNYFEDMYTTYKEYIKIAVLPDIYRELLVCQYLYDQNYLTLGKSYSRKADIIKITSNTTYPAATQNLFKAYCKDVISDTSVDSKLYGLTFLDALSKGCIDYAEMDATTQALVDKIYADAGWTKFTTAEVSNLTSAEQKAEFVTIRKESTYGGYITNYLKIFDPSYTSDTDILKDFTNSGAYTSETGLAIKKQSLIATDNTKHGWFSKTDLSDAIPSDANTRLFKMGVASEVDSADLDKGQYVWKVNGEDYLVSANYETGNEYPYLISDSGTWYIVKVNEAVRSAKLQSTSDDYYGDEKAEIFARSIAATLSSSDTYKKDSNKFFVDKMAATYHDTSIYNYFKTTFPDLFD